MTSYGRQRRAVQGHRHARLEADDHFDRRRVGDPRERVHVVGRRRPRVLDLAALDRLAPQVVVDRVQLLLRHRDGDLPLGGKLDAVLAGQPPHPGRRVDPEVRRQRANADLEAHLVVALARAPVGDRRRAVPARLGDQMPHDDRPRQRGHQRVLALVAGVRRQSRHAEVLGHLVAGVDDDGLDGPGGQRPGRARHPSPPRPCPPPGRRPPPRRRPRRPRAR